MHPYIIPGIKRASLTDQEVAQLANSKKISITEILAVVCRFYQVEVHKVQSPSRKRELVEARQVYCYMSKLYTKASLKSIADIIGGRDHTTAMHSIAEVKNHILTEPDYKRNIILLEGLIEKRFYGATIKTEAAA